VGSVVEAKLLHQGIVAVRCAKLDLDHFAPRVNWFREISRGNLGICNSSINKDRGWPRQPSLPSKSL
jgi:hypothetical protein